MFIMRNEFKSAVERANIINSMLKKRGIEEDDFAPLDTIIECVQEIAGYSEIEVSRRAFSRILNTDNSGEPQPSGMGAMLSTSTKFDEPSGKTLKSALLVLNTDFPAEKQRFSLVHELGHLITGNTNFHYETPNDGKFTISTHIHSDITYITEEECEKDEYLVAEQTANIFALLVLIRKNLRIRDLTENGIRALTQKYGVTEDALFSRMLLTYENEEDDS